MGRAPCCDKANVKRGPWSPEEDMTLKNYIERYGTGGNWIALPQKAGLKRCGKSCRLRWLNYLRPNIKHGEFSDEEDRIIFNLFITIGSRWSIIAAQLPGRTDNDIKNYWNTKLKKKLMGLLPNPIRKPQPPPQPIQQTKPRTSSSNTTTITPPHLPSLLFSSSFQIQPSPQQPAQPQAMVSPFYHSYVNNYPFSSDNNTMPMSTSSVATVNSIRNSCYEPFSKKDHEFVDFGSDPRNCNSHGNYQQMIIKQEEEFVRHDVFEFEFDQRINKWAETMSECCFGTEFDLISGRGTNLIDHDHNHNHNHNHHGMNKLGAEEMGLY